jgi:hypothetical protein
MMKATILDGITRRSRCGQMVNPSPHSPLQLQNEVVLELVGPEGLRQRVLHKGNIMATYGLNRLVEMIVSDAGGASAFVNHMIAGSDTTAAASTNTGLGNSYANSTKAVTRSDSGNLTAAYLATIDHASAMTINEIGVFQTNEGSASMIARSVLGTSINKASDGTVNCTYKIIAGTV